MDILAACETPAEVLAALEDLPSSLESTYTRCLMRQRYGKLLCKPKVLKWSAAALEPLSIDYVREMLAIDPRTGDVHREDMPTSRSVTQSAVGLLSFVGNERLIVPAHHTVRQYLFSQSLKNDLRKSNKHFDTTTREELTLSMNDTICQIAQISLSHIRARTGLQLAAPQVITAPPLYANIPKIFRNVLGFRNQKAVHLKMPLLRRPLDGSSDSDFLQYAIRTWTSHTKSITSEAACWEDFQYIALQRDVSQIVHPWSLSTRGTKNTHLRGLFGFAVSHNHVPLLRLILEQPASLPKEVYNHVLPGNELLPALHVAAGAGYVEVVQLLLSLCDVNALCRLQRTALHYAAANGHERVVHLCLTAGALLHYFDRDGLSPFDLAVRREHEAVIMRMVQSMSVSRSEQVDSASNMVVEAIKRGNLKTFNVLLRIGIVNTREKVREGMTPLAFAAQTGSLEIVKMLLDTGKVDPDARNDYG